MPITMGGMASGMDTDEIIEKLVNVEAQPLKQMHEEKAEYGEKKKALQELESKLRKLERSVKDLYGFRAMYDNKSIVSSNPEIVEATASKLAEKGTRHITVMQRAGTHKITTDRHETGKEFDGGVLRIAVEDDERSLRFRGGTLEQLRNKIDDTFGETVSTSLVTTGADAEVLVLESKAEGKKGEMKITGDLPFLRKLGLVDGYKDEEKDQVDLVFDSTYFQDYTGENRDYTEDGTLRVADDGRSFDLEGVLWREYVLANSYDVTEDTVLEFEAAIQEDEEDRPDEFESLPHKVELGPSEETVIRGIQLEGYNISRERPTNPPEEEITTDDILGVGVLYENEEGERREKIYTLDPEAEGMQQIPVGDEFAGQTISRLVFYCNKGQATFTNASLSTPLEGQNLLNPKNIIAEAQNAHMKIDDIEMERDKNEGITDAIKGVTLNLNGADENHPVELTIDHDIDGAVEKIKKFVKVYNEYLEYNKQMTKAEKTEKTGQHEKSKKENGPFMGDMTIIRIENMLNQTVSAAYPSTADEPIKLLTQIGLSTGELNASWGSIKEGKLVLDEEKLRTKLMENPEGVKELFGSDTDGDNDIDNGFAYTVEQKLKPYMQPGKNIIANKVSLQEDSIDRIDKRMERKEEHLKAYQEKLRKKFTNMEKTMSGSKQQQQWMQQQMGGGGGGGGAGGGGGGAGGQ